MKFQSKQFYFIENKEAPDTKTDLFSTNQNWNKNKDCYDIAEHQLLATFDIKMPENDGYNTVVDGAETQYNLTREDNEHYIWTNTSEYNIGVPYRITIMSEAETAAEHDSCDIQIYTTRDQIQESLIDHYKEYLNLGIIVIKYMDIYFSTNAIFYKNKVIYNR